LVLINIGEELVFVSVHGQASGSDRWIRHRAIITMMYTVHHRANVMRHVAHQMKAHHLCDAHTTQSALQV